MQQSFCCTPNHSAPWNTGRVRGPLRQAPHVTVEVQLDRDSRSTNPTGPRPPQLSTRPCISAPSPLYRRQTHAVCLTKNPALFCDKARARKSAHARRFVDDSVHWTTCQAAMTMHAIFAVGGQTKSTDTSTALVQEGIANATVHRTDTLMECLFDGSPDTGFICERRVTEECQYSQNTLTKLA